MSEHGLAISTAGTTPHLNYFWNRALTSTVELSAPVEQPSLFTPPPERNEDQEDPHALHDLRVQLDDTEAHIDAYNNALRNAQLVRAHLRQAINEQLKTRPPIHKFPPEVLARIFWYYTRLGLESKEPFLVFETATGPWPLGQVCRKWRTIAWDTPRLWSSFSLDWEGFDDMPENRQPDVMDLFTEVFSRTKQAPLAVRINFQHDTWVHAFFYHITREAHRLEELAVAGTLGQLRRGLTTLFRRLPALKSLTLTITRKYGPNGDAEDHIENGPIASIFAPQLTRLDVYCLGYLPRNTSSTMAPPLPYAQLRHLEISSHNGFLPLILSALKQCTNLETFHDLSHHSMSEPGPQPQISLNKLKAISMKSTSLLSCITAPALTILLLPFICDVFYYNGDADPTLKLNTVLSVVTSFQERSQCRIETAFFLPILPGDACKNFLRGFAYLKSLAINAWEEDKYTSSFISLLKRDPEETFMPQLDTLNVCLSATPHLTCLLGLQPEVPQDTAIEVALAQVIASRRRNVPPDQPMLRAVNILYICPGWDNGTRSRVDLDLDDMFTAVTATTFYHTLCDLEGEGLALCVDYLPDQQYYYWYVHCMPL